jgi:hypothetical protein
LHTGNILEDPRPAQDDIFDDGPMTRALEDRGVTWPLNGFAPGSYMGRCRRCERRHMGSDKRSQCCVACAVIGAMETGQEAMAKSRDEGRRLGRHVLLREISLLAERELDPGAVEREADRQQQGSGVSVQTDATSDHRTPD